MNQRRSMNTVLVRSFFDGMEMGTEDYHITGSLKAVVQVGADLASMICHDRSNGVGTLIGSEILSNHWVRSKVVCPNGKRIDTRASAPVIMTSILDSDGKFVLLSKLQTLLDVFNRLGIHIVVGHSSLKTGIIANASSCSQGAFLVAPHASAKSWVMVTSESRDDVQRR